MNIGIRTIEALEWREYRAIRLVALKDSPDAFGSTYEESATRTDDESKARVEQASPGKATL